MNRGGNNPVHLGCVLVILGSALLLLGCRSASPKPAKGQKPAAQSKAHEENEEDVAAAHAHYAAGVIHEMNHESDAAMKEYYQAALMDPSDETFILDLSSKFIETKQLDKAVEVLSRRASQPDASGAVYARLGAIYSQMGKTNEALAANRAAVKKSPELFAGYQNLFLTFLQNKRYTEALKVLDEAAAQPKADAEFLVSLAGYYLRLGVEASDLNATVKGKARTALERAEKLNPSNPSLKLQLAEGFNAIGDYGKAAQIYLDLLKNLPDVPLIRERVHARLTDIYLHSDDRKRAAEQLQAIIKDDPTNPQAYYWLGNIALDQKQFQEAAADFNRCLLLKSDFEPAYYDLALAQLNLDKPGEALSTLEKARVKFPVNFSLEFWTGMALSRQKAYKEALRHYTEAEVLARTSEPKRLNELFYFQVGAAFERSGDSEQAEKYFQKCLDASPNFAEALNYLGYMWAEHGKKLPEARDLIEKAVKIEPKNPAYLDSLGWVLFKMGEPKQGLENVLKAAEFSEQPDATIYDHLGDIYAALKETDKAREAWQKSLSLEASEAVQKKLADAPDK